jgi:hypothetical protein
MRSFRPAPWLGPLIVFALAIALALMSTCAEGQTPSEIHVVVLVGEFTPGGAAPASSQADAMKEVAAMWTAASLGKTRITWEIGPRTLIDREAGKCNQFWSQQATSAAQAAGLRWDKLIFVQQYDEQCKYGGEATLGGCCAFENSGTNIFVIEHEGGHSWFGLPHSYGAFFVGVFGDFADAIVKEYGHRTDVMSGGDTVAAMWRYRLGWLVPQRIPRDGAWHRVHLEPITQKQDAFSIQREDGIEWWGERRVIGQAAESLDVTSTYGGVPTWSASPGVGEDVDDPVGGVTIRSLGGGDYSVRSYTPTYVPPVIVQPTPGPVQNTPTPPPAECWAQFPFIRCTPTPTMTPSSVPETTATPTETPLPEATETPAPSPTPTETPTETPTPVREPTSVPPTPPPPVVPGLPRPRGGCLGMDVFGVALTYSSLRIWKRLRQTD